MRARAKARAPTHSDAETTRVMQGARVGTVQARASEHDIAMVLQNIRVNAMPKKFDRTFVAIWCEHAGTAKLQKLKFGMARKQPSDVELARGVKTAIIFGERLPQKPIRSNDGRTIQCAAIAYGMVENQQVVADSVIAIDIPTGE